MNIGDIFFLGLSFYIYKNKFGLSDLQHLYHMGLNIIHRLKIVLFLATRQGLSLHQSEP